MVVRATRLLAGLLPGPGRRGRRGRGRRRGPGQCGQRGRDGPGPQLRLPADHLRRQEVLPGRPHLRHPRPLAAHAPQRLQPR